MIKYEKKKKKNPLYNINTYIGEVFFFHILSFIFVIEFQIPVIVHMSNK